MRVQGSLHPLSISIYSYPLKKGYVDVRLRENVSEKVIDMEAVFEYDEYSIIVKDTENLLATIEANLESWMITGRTLEVNEGASVIQDLKAALAAIYSGETIE